MRYELHAVIARPEVLEPIVDLSPYARAVLLDGAELALVPMTERLYAAIDLEGLRVDPGSGFARLSPGVAAVVTAASRRGAIAYLEADYTGDRGHQVAAAWLDCHIVYGPRLLVSGEPVTPDGTSPFCRALGYLGVQAVGRSDAFVVLGLGRHRRTEEWWEAGALP